MEYGDTETDHLNAFNTLVRKLTSIAIKMEKEKCITFLCSFPYSWAYLVVVIDNETYSTLNFGDVVASLLLKEMKRKSMDGVEKDALSMRSFPREEI